MDVHLRVGIAIYNAGEYHAAHDAWEDHWLDLDSGTADERFLHGLIQFTAAVYHARNRNWSGATGLATSAIGYLEDLPADYRSVNLGAVRTYLATLGADPEYIERQDPVALEYRGEPIGTADLGFEETLVAAAILAEEYGYDEELVEDAIEFARADGPEDPSSVFVPLLFDFVREPANRDVVVQRIGEHRNRRSGREADVDGLFEDDQ